MTPFYATLIAVCIGITIMGIFYEIQMFLGWRDHMREYGKTGLYDDQAKD